LGNLTIKKVTTAALPYTNAVQGQDDNFLERFDV